LLRAARLRHELIPRAFPQIHPVGGTSIYKAMMEHPVARLPPDSPMARGIRLLQSASIFQLDVQQRSLHAEHSANIVRMSSVDPKVPPITLGLLAAYPAITHADLERDPLWRDAPIVVVNNAIRIRINTARLLDHAQREGLPILVWDNVLSGNNAEALSAAEIANLYKSHPELQSYFVAGTPSFLRDNISTEKGIVNGAPCVTHSLNLHPGEAEERRKRNAEAALRHRARRQHRLEAAAARAAAGDAAEPEPADDDSEALQLPCPPLKEALLHAAPGEQIRLALPPLSINVRLQEPHLSRFSKNDTLLKGAAAALVPVPISRFVRYEEIKPWELLNKARSPIASVGYMSHGIEPSYAITFHKVRPLPSS
jgi:hypothetical protein